MSHPARTALIDTDQTTYSRCTGAGSQLRALDPIATGWLTDDGLSERLTEIPSEAYESTLADTRFTKMRAQVNECIVESSGYEVGTVGKDLGGVAVSEDWSATDRSAAMSSMSSTTVRVATWPPELRVLESA